LVIWDMSGIIKLLVIMLGLIVVPFVWVKIRKEKSTDREGRDAPPPDKRLKGEMDPRSNLPLYGPGRNYTAEAIGKEWAHPDLQYYREKMERDKREAEEKKETQ
jgi:hypothetical protein